VEDGSLETGNFRSFKGISKRINPSPYLFRFLPEGNSVQIPPFAVHRDPDYFSPMSKEFLPQRWFSDADSGPASLTLEGDIVLERSAFIPFSMGPANCVGKGVALKQLRYVPALLLRNFRFEFSEGYNPDRWEEELQDRFLMAKGELPLRMVPRE
jgi:cytochrome P450